MAGFEAVVETEAPDVGVGANALNARDFAYFLDFGGGGDLYTQS